MKKLLIATILSTAAFSANAEIVKPAPELAPANAPAAEITYPPKISFEEAKEIAVNAVKDTAKVVEAELEQEEGQQFTYEIEVEAGGVVTEVEIDAATGNIMEMGADD